MTPRQSRRQPSREEAPPRERAGTRPRRAPARSGSRPPPDDAPHGSAPAEPSPPAALANLIGYHLRLAQEASFAAIRQGLGNSDLKAGWYTILTILSDNPGITPTDLSRLCGRDRSTLTATLKGFTARGLITSRRKAGDQRSYGVWLTSSGAAMLRRLQTIARAHDAKLDAIVGEHKPLLISLLKRIVAGLGQDQRPRRRKRRAPDEARAT